MGITPQITLLGQRADEAVQNVEKYLDDAYAAGLTQARLVHGKGTGALRRAVQEYLDGTPWSPPSPPPIPRKAARARRW